DDPLLFDTRANDPLLVNTSADDPVAHSANACHAESPTAHRMESTSTVWPGAGDFRVAYGRHNEESRSKYTP
ncbi:MAG TPA: hypothetical protein VGG67_06035, partial [Steroidobacteraceae bacterium]